MSPNRYEMLTEVFRNPTKFRIILLLSEHGRMTVTDMAKLVKVSRSNLYHFIAQMVKDGIVKPPEVIPRKNYVEKFYRLNDEMFKAEDMKEWEKLLRIANAKEIKETVSSILMGYSMILNFIADRISASEDDDVEHLRKWLIEETPYTLSYAVMSKKTSSRINPILKELWNALSEETERDDNSDTNAWSRLLLVFLPMLGTPI
ncbi:MAG: ArsR family transcriptional regulator [Candidatus Thermoplasmatota archaeon]|nr:ArsR family transcriptional regulator [Candidatus Thermoplasmatota archaeon]